MRWTAFAGAVLLCAVALSTARAANVLVNGDFETPSLAVGNQEFDSPSTAITGWTVAAGSVDLVHNGVSVLGQSHSGDQMLDINGLAAGTIRQRFPTVVNQRYTLDLFYSNNPNPSFALPSYSAQVQLTGAMSGLLLDQTLVHAGATTANMNYLEYTVSFVANSVFTTLLLSSNQAGTNGVYFDTVSVVPEPSTLLLATIGCVSLLAIGRRFSPRRGFFSTLRTYPKTGYVGG